MTYPERQFTRSVLWHLLALGLLTITLLVCCSCSSTKQVTQVIEHVSKDTVYLSNLRYDSIYIFESHSSDYHPANIDQDESFAHRSARPFGTLAERGGARTLGARPKTDTVFVKDVSVEYRYKLLRDTTRIVQRDSIPYPVTVTEIREVARSPTLFDRLCRISFWVLSTLILLLFLTITSNLKKRISL